MVRLNPLLLGALGLLASCAVRPPDIPGSADDGAPARRLDPEKIADATPRMEPKSRYGNPDSYVVLGSRYKVMKDGTGFSEKGIASWYGTKFHGRRTSSGEPYDMYAMTAAHKNLPLPCYVRVTNLRNGRQAVVKVNDRGPFHENRIIDLSYAAATKLGILAQGTGFVEIEVIDPRRPRKDNMKESRPNGIPRELFIQVGAFSQLENAEQLRHRLRLSLSQQIRIQPTESRGRRMYRVQVGPIQDVTDADALALKLSQLNVRNTRLVVEE